MLYNEDEMYLNVSRVWGALSFPRTNRRSVKIETLTLLTQSILDEIMPEPYDVDIYADAIELLVDTFLEVQVPSTSYGRDSFIHDVAQFVYDLHEIA